MKPTEQGCFKVTAMCLLLGIGMYSAKICAHYAGNSADKESLAIALESTTLRQNELKAALDHELKRNFIWDFCRRAKACADNERSFQEATYRKIVLNALSDEMRDGELKIYALQKMLWQAPGAIRALAPSRDTISRSFAALRGKLPWPIFSGNIKKGLNRHGQGVTIPVMNGAIVHAIHPGNVVFADELRGYGQLIIVEHDDGFMSLYGQNRTLRKKVGDPVNRGEAIAEVGDTDNDAGLYFEIRENGNAVDPARFCQKDSLTQ